MKRHIRHISPTTTVLAHDLTSEMEKDYPLSKILPKFVFIDALSYLTENDNDKFRERLTTLLERWPTPT